MSYRDKYTWQPEAVEPVGNSLYWLIERKHPYGCQNAQYYVAGHSPNIVWVDDPIEATRFQSEDAGKNNAYLCVSSTEAMNSNVRVCEHMDMAGPLPENICECKEVGKTLAAPQASAPAEQPKCKTCGGSGLVNIMTTNEGPDSQFEDVDCPRCDASGIESAAPAETDLDALVARLKQGASISRDRNINLDYAKVADQAAQAITDLRAKLDAGQCRVELLESDMKSGTYETLYAQQAARITRLEAKNAGVVSAAPLAHARSCGMTGTQTTNAHEECSCCLKERIAVQTEQTMHAAWRKRAEEAEAANEEARELLRNVVNLIEAHGSAAWVNDPVTKACRAFLDKGATP